MWETLLRRGMTVEVLDPPSGVPPYEVLRTARLVHADLPRLYYATGTPDEEVDLGDFPNLSPRFGRFFVEYRMMAQRLGGTEPPRPSWEDPMWRKGQWNSGLLFESVDLRGDRYVTPAGQERLRKLLSGVAGDGAYAEDVRWCLTAYLFCAHSRGFFPEGPLVAWLLPICEDGSVKINKLGEGPSLTAMPLADPHKTTPAQKAYAWDAQIYLFPALFAVAVMNSPLTRLVPANKGEPGPQGKTYDIDTDRLVEVLNTRGQAEEHGLPHAMLACRKHFSRA